MEVEDFTPLFLSSELLVMECKAAISVFAALYLQELSPDRFDTILEEATDKGDEDKWVLPCDLPEHSHVSVGCRKVLVCVCLGSSVCVAVWWASIV